MTPGTARTARVAGVLNVVPLGLAIVAEAAWISVVAGLVQEYALREPTIGIVALAAFVASGAVAGRVLAPRLGGRWPLAVIALMAVAGATGWLLSPQARVALGEVGVGHALAVNPGGWLAALAVLRGIAHARLPLGERTLGRLLAVGVPGLAIAAVAGGMVAEPWRSLFLADALVASIVFAVAATLSLAMARLTAIGADSGFDWQRNPAWVGLLIVLVAATTAVAIPAAFVAGPVISLLVGISIGPAVMIGLVIGFERRTIRVLAAFVAAAILLFGVLTLVGGAVQPSPPPGATVASPAEPADPGQAVAIGAALVALVAVLAAVVLARLWMKRVGRTEEGVAETRTIDRGSGERSRPRFGRRRRPPPVDAVSAYIALDRDLAPNAELRRQLAETPAEHARRLRHAGYRELPLDLLAADYALARYAGVPLSPTEDRRAVARWRLLRERLGVAKG